MLRPRARVAVTVTPAWGVSAAPPTDGPLGRPGPWAVESAAIERAYGRSRTVHVSLEEFARTLTVRAENRERLREGGVPARQIPVRLADAERRGELATYRQAFERFRAFERPNVLHLFATFAYDRRFAAEFPAAVQCGPLYSGRRSTRRGPPSREPEWIWYASPPSAEGLVDDVLAGLARADGHARLVVRTPRSWAGRHDDRALAVVSSPLPSIVWRRRFDRAAVRIVTGSRTLLEAVEHGGPFLYFNGLLGRGAGRRRHRPEKIVQLLRLARHADWPTALIDDLGAFSRGARVAEVAASAASRVGPWRAFPRLPRSRGMAPGYEEAGPTLVRFVRHLAEGADPGEAVAAARATSHR